jgi:hypothetical protein
MDKLIGERSRIGIISLSDLGEYYRQFLAITTYLRSKNRLSEAEQSRAFVRGFPPTLWSVISQRLQLKLPDHFPDDPYPLDSIHEAARFALHGTPASATTSVMSTQVVPTSQTSAPVEVKMEEFTTILERITESFVKALTAASSARASDRPPRPPQSGPRSNNCHFCDLPDHYGRDCEVAADYIKQGKCKRNIEGRITLPSGAFIPRDIPGKCFKERLDEWHHRNPGQTAAGQLMYNVFSQVVSEPRVVLATRQTHPDIFEAQTVLSPQLSTQDRINSLECELLQLRNRKLEGTARPKSRNDRTTNVEITEEAPPRKQVMRPEVVINRTRPPVTRSAPAPSSEPVTVEATPAAVDNGPTHPYADVPDATYAPPVNCNFAATPKQAPAKKAEPAYKTLPPVYDGKIATDVYDRAMATQVTLTQRELLSLSPEVHSQVREATSARRTAATNKEPLKSINTLVNDDSISAALDDLEADEPDDAPTSMFINSLHQTATPPPGSLIVPDPYETYLKLLPDGAVPEQLIVAKESSALQSIFPLVDHQQHVESILDPGSQIIAMSENVCMDLALIYDPTIILNMQSANGEVDKSLGLACNVPIRIGEITLYVQIHVIRSPAYDILLGRPFDILTQSIIHNFANEDQTITLRDPNSGICATVPTLARGRPRHVMKRPSFAKSMN